MSTTTTPTATPLTLRGSTDIIAEYFYYSVNNILYTRGVYPQDQFRMTKHYDMNLLVTTNSELVKYLDAIMKQLKEWILDRAVQKLVLVITSVNSGEALERWQFDLHHEGGVDVKENTVTPPKAEKEIQQEIQSLIRQIIGSVTFLPMLDDVCSFDLLVYTKNSLDVPMTWEESDARLVKNGTEMKYRSFSTGIHKVDTVVSYRDPKLK